MEDLTLPHLFSLKEYSSTQELPCLGALWFRLISEGFFTHIASPDMWGKTGVGFVTLTALKKSGGTTNMAMFSTNGIGGRDLGMVMVFCHPDQARIKACNALSTLWQHDLSELSMVVVRRYSNTPYIPKGMSHALYLDMGTFPRGTASVQFPTDRLITSLQHLRFAATMWGGGRGVEDFPPISQSSYGIVQQRNTIFPIPSPCESPCPLLCHLWKSAPRLRKD